MLCCYSLYNHCSNVTNFISNNIVILHFADIKESYYGQIAAPGHCALHVVSVQIQIYPSMVGAEGPFYGHAVGKNVSTQMQL